MEQTTAAPSNFSDADDSILYQYVAPVLFSLVFLIGFIGNRLLILTVMAHSAMRSVSNIFLLSLAIGDMLVIVVVTPLRIMLYIDIDTYMGMNENLCRINDFLIELSQGVSIFTLTALAGDRFVAIVLPMTALGWSTKKKTIIITVLMWILAFIFAFPGIVTIRLKTFSIMVEGTMQNISYCSFYGIFNTTDIDYHPYVLSSRILNLIVYYIIPLLIITFMYVSIAVTLTRSSRSVREVLSSSANVNLKKQIMARRHIAKMVLVIVVLFFICWTPYRVIIYFKYFSHSLSYEGLTIYFFVRYLFPLLNSCVNPPALYFMNTEFRRYFNHYLFGWCC